MSIRLDCYSVTTTAAGSFTVNSQAGSSNSASWVGQFALTATTTIFVSGGTKDLILSVPSIMVDLPYGSEFESMKVEFKTQYTGTTGSYAETAWLTYVDHRDGTLFDLGYVSNGSETTHTLDGNKAYWGIRGTSSQLFRDLKDGKIKFNYMAGGAGSGVTYSIGDIDVTLTYRPADQQRASFIVTLP